MGKKAEINDLLFILALCVAMSWQLFCNRTLFTHDGLSNFVHSIVMLQSWREGRFFCRWTPYLVHGYGYPILNFYAPFFFYLTALLMLPGLPVFFAFNLGFVLMLVLSGWGMYLLARDIWGRQGGLLAATAYLLAPYHLLNLYVRGAAAEFTGMALTPLLLWAILRVARRPNGRDIAIGILASAGLILAHSISAMLFFSTALLYLLWLYFTEAPKDLKKLAAGLSILAGGCLLSAYFWLPALLEKKFVSIDVLLTGRYDFRNNFITLSQLLLPRWPKENHELSFMLGPVHILLALPVIVLASKIAKAAGDSLRQIIFFTLFLIFSIFFMLKISLPVWQAVPLLAFTEFPWRFLACAVFSLSVLAGGVVYLFPESLKKAVLWTAIGALLLFNLPLCHAFGYREISFTTPLEYVKSALPMDGMEYIPQWVQKVTLYHPSEKLQAIHGQAQIISKQGDELDQRYSVLAYEPVMFAYYSYYFPGWKVEVDGQEADIHIDNILGVFGFAVPAGLHKIRIYFGTTPVREAGELISVISFVLFLLWGIFSCIGCRRRANSIQS